LKSSAGSTSPVSLSDSDTAWRESSGSDSATSTESSGRSERFEVALSLRHWTGRSYGEVLAAREEGLLALDRRMGDTMAGANDMRKTSSSDLIALSPVPERSFHRRLPSEDRLNGSGRVPKSEGSALIRGMTH
jgi:hypothetical protein